MPDTNEMLTVLRHVDKLLIQIHNGEPTIASDVPGQITGIRSLLSTVIDDLAADNTDSVKSRLRMPRDVPDTEWRAISESLPHGAWIEPASDDTWIVSHPEGGEVDFTDLDKAVRYAKAHAMPLVPDDFPVQPIDEEDVGDAEDPMQCGTCNRWWDDGVVTALTPTPSARCPFEYFHPDPDGD